MTDRTKELLEKNPLSTEEMQEVVESYIYDRKGRRVRIDLDNTVIPTIPQIEIAKLQQAFWCAFNYYKRQ